MSQAFFEDGFSACKVVLRLFNGIKNNSFAIVVEIGPHQQSVIMFFLSLDIVPVGKAIEAIVIEVVGKGQIQIFREKFFINLSIN